MNKANRWEPHIMITPTKKLVTVLIGLFLGEAAIMALINMLQFPSHVEAIADAAALILIALPILHHQFARPMFQQYQALEAANRTAETLLASSTQFASSIELDQVLRTLFQQTRGLVAYDFAAVYTLLPPDRLVRKAAWIAGQVQPEDPERAPLSLQDFSPLVQVVQERKSALTAGAPFPVEEAGRLHTWLTIPFIAGGQVTGLFLLAAERPAAFTREQIRLAEGIASQAAIAIQNAEQYEQVRESQARLKVLTHQLVEVQERERRQVAVELHENMVQTIAATLMKVRFLEDKARPDQAVRAGLEDVDQELHALYQDLRKMAIHLRPLVLDTGGLRAAIRQELDRLREENRIETELVELGQAEALPKRAEIILYRIVQEALANVVQHARATRVSVSLVQGQDHFILGVKDDGIGFSLNKQDQIACLGIIEMRERAEMLGGALSIASSPGAGTEIEVTIPV